MSLRGSIRKPPSLLAWIGTLQGLKQHGYEDSAAVISRFNGSVAKSFQLQGSKATAIGNIMTHCPQSLIDLLQDHASKYGWENCVLSDDNLSSKKILPNFVFRAPHKAWKRFTAMSPKSCELTFRRLMSEFEKTTARRKADRCLVEQFAEQAALLVNLAKLLQEQHPVPDSDVARELFDKWVDGNVQLDMELHETQSEKRESLTVLDLKCLRALVETLQCKVPLSDAGAQEVKLQALEKDQFDLTVKQIDYDRQAFRIYKAKLESHQTHVHMTKVEWKQKVRAEAMGHQLASAALCDQLR